MNLLRISGPLNVGPLAPEWRHSRRLLVVLPLCAVFGAFGAIVWLSHPGGVPLGEPPLIRTALAPIKMMPMADELLSDQSVPAPSKRLLLPSPPRPLTLVATRAQANALPVVDGTSAAANGQQIQAAALPASERDDVDRQDREQPMLIALAAEAKRLDLLTSPVADAGSPRPPGSTGVPAALSAPASTAELEDELPRPEPVSAERNAAEAPASPATPPETSVLATTTALATAGAAASPVPGRTFRVQLAAVRAETDARRVWQQLLNDHGGTLSELEPHFERAETNNGAFYRVQVGPLASAVAADSLCDELKQRNASCFIVRR